LDEPSTGLDPASRRKLWELISEGKKGRSIVLTTHSMEEADVLCDRIGIMCKSVVQCIDYPHNLKLRFGKGYKIVVTSDVGREEEIFEFINALCNNRASYLMAPMNGVNKIEAARDDVVLSRLYEQFELRREDLGVSDFAVTETTLEEVFLSLSNNPIRRGKVQETGSVTTVKTSVIVPKNVHIEL